MTKTLKHKLVGLSAARRTKIASRTAALIAEEQSLRDLRQAMELTQEKMAKELGIGQESVSRLENRSDLLISTLRDYVEAMGGKLNLIAEFPNRPPVQLQGIATFKPKVIKRSRGAVGKAARKGKMTARGLSAA